MQRLKEFCLKYDCEFSYEHEDDFSLICVTDRETSRKLFWLVAVRYKTRLYLYNLEAWCMKYQLYDDVQTHTTESLTQRETDIIAAMQHIMSGDIDIRRKRGLLGVKAYMYLESGDKVAIVEIDEVMYRSVVKKDHSKSST